MGLENALSEITLVLFTTLAPSGVVACLMVGAVLLFSHLSDESRALLNRILALPLVVALVGLVASATHLGNPGNALYVLAGIGRSPLSNEVLAGVVFFGLAGSFWFYSFSQKRNVAIERLWVLLYSIAGVLFLIGIAFAYDVETIITWHTSLVPLALVLNAFVGGPLLGLCSFAAANKIGGTNNLLSLGVARAGIIVSLVASVANIVCYIQQVGTLSSLSNSIVSFTQLAPAFPVGIAAFAVLCLAAVAVDALMLRRTGQLRLPDTAVAAVLSLMGIFIMRFMFYMTHMTAGLAY